MAITPADFLVGLSPSPIGVVIGNLGTLQLTFSNISATDTAYNLSVSVTLPDGVSYSASSIPPTSVVTNPSGTISLNWVNITDLAPNQVNYTINLEVQADETFRSTGLPVPFDVPLSTITVSGTVDTLPRGDDDPGNVQITKSQTSDLIPLRYNVIKNAPGKEPKGAGLITPPTSPLWPFTYHVFVQNNSREASTVTLIDNLPNGMRYLDSLFVIGPDAAVLSTPTVILPSVTQNFTTLDWGTVTVSAGSTNEITFTVAIWDRFTVGGVENSGAIIPHGTSMVNTVTINGLSGPVSGTSTTVALDALINKSVTPSQADVGSVLTYTLTYEINQYENVNTFVITDVLSDGQTYNPGSASVPPTSITVNLDGTTTIIWELGDLPTGTTGTITFTSTVDATFSSGDPVVAQDTLSNNVSISGVNAVTLENTPDSSSTSVFIIAPSISKSIVNYYYADGTVKPFDVAAPGDSVEFQIVYDATALTAEQKNIFVDEYPPLNMGPLPPPFPIVYGGTFPTPTPPVTVSPNGLRWVFGTVPAGVLWTANIRIPVLSTPFVGSTSSNNLVKFGGTDTPDFAYSGRDQVAVDFGEPNIQFDKAVSPSTNPVEAGELYTYIITISNPTAPGIFVTDAYNMLLTDVIPTGMTYTGISTVSGSGSFDPPVFLGQNVSMTINQLAPGELIILTYQVSVDATVPAGIQLTNNAVLQRPYSQPDLSFQYPGDPFQADVTKDTEGVAITKEATPSTGKLGEDLTYTLTVTVPAGTIAYTPLITDNLPIGQTYIGPATRQQLPGPVVPVVPSVVGQLVTFPINPDIDATLGAVTIIYTFVARITSATHLPPYQETQTNSTTVAWAVTPGGPLDVSNTGTFDVTATTPNLTIEKEQRDFTTGGTYTIGDIVVNPGDTIYYRYTITSDGASPAYNIQLLDPLSDNITFASIISGPSTGTVTPPTPPPLAVLQWDIPQLNNGGTATLEIAVQFTNFPGASQLVQNQIGGTYDSNDVNPETYTVGSNIVEARAPSLQLTKVPSKTTVNVGDTITYVLTVVVPADTVAYNVVLSDTLPPGQTYANNAKRNFYPVTPTIVGQVVTFPLEPSIEAIGTSKTIIYSFNATITSAVPPYPQVQTNDSIVNWDTTPIGEPAIPVSSSADVNVNQQPPYRGIGIEDISSADAMFLGDWDME